MRCINTRSASRKRLITVDLDSDNYSGKNCNERSSRARTDDSTTTQKQANYK